MEAHSRDSGKKIVRIPRKIMKRLKVSIGDVVEIYGETPSVALVWPAHPSDGDEEIIRMDNVLRRTINRSIGEYVLVKKVQLPPALSVELKPLHEIKLSGDLTGYIKKNLVGLPLRSGDLIQIPILGRQITYKVEGVTPEEGALVTAKTSVKILAFSKEEKEFEEVGYITYESIGGLKEEVEKVREVVELPLKHPELFKKIGIEPPKGILLYGPPGTGKTLIAKAVANEAKAHFITINGPEIIGKYYGESEERLRETFRNAEENAPSIIFIDEIDAIAPKREEATGEVERRVVAQFLTLLDGLKARGQIVVIGATNRIDAIDPALRRPGRFDREIEIGVPNKEGRKEILEIHTRGMPLSPDVDLDELASLTHGFVGADLANLCKEAAMLALRKFVSKIPEEGVIPVNVLEHLKVTKSDFMTALKNIKPSALREYYVEIPEVRWSDIGDLENVKRALKESVELYVKHPEVFKNIGIKPPTGILLFGPPGCGKTLLAKALATESGLNFISVKGPELLSKWVGESERAIRRLFQKARESAPCILFLDEIDAIAPKRISGVGISDVENRIVSTLLTEMDGISGLENVSVIAATNRPDIIDPALLRPGRFEKILYIPLPNEEARYKILQTLTRKMPLDEKVDLKLIAKKADGYTGADLSALVREAGLIAIRENINVKKIEMRHFEAALLEVSPSLSEDDIERYRALAKKICARPSM